MQPVFANRRKSWCDLVPGDGHGNTRYSGDLARFGSTPTISTTASCRTTATSDTSLNPSMFFLNEGLGDFWGLSDTPEAKLEQALSAPNSEDVAGGLDRSDTFSLGEAIGDFFGLGGSDPKQVQPTPAKMTQAASLLMQQQTRQHHCPRIELEDIEVTDMPYAVYFKLRAVLPGNDWSPISVMKSYKDLKDLHHALQQTLSSGWLPAFPTPTRSRGLNDSAFLMQMDDYLSCIAGNKEAVYAHFIQDFFRATDEYRERHEAPWIELRPPSHVKLQESQSLDVASSVLGRSSFCSAPSSSNAQASEESVTKSIAAARDQIPNLESAFKEASALKQQLVDDLKQHRAERAEAQPTRERPATWENQASAQAHSAPVLCTAAASSPSPVPLPPRPPASLPSQETKPKLSSEGSDISKSDLTDMTRSSAGSSNSKRTRRRRPKCVVCLAKVQETAIDPCGHICMCQDCTTVVRECPVCRGPITKVLRVFVA